MPRFLRTTRISECARGNRDVAAPRLAYSKPLYVPNAHALGYLDVAAPRLDIGSGRFLPTLIALGYGDIAAAWRGFRIRLSQR